MNRIINTGLCALLVGATSFALGDSNKLGNPKRSKTTSATSQNTFLGPGGNYSTNCNPRDYGFTLEEHIKFDNFDREYNDRYNSENGSFLEVTRSKKIAGLQETFDFYCINYFMAISQGIEMGFRPGEGMRIVGKGKPKELTIDDNPALQGGGELWLYKHQSEMLKGNYGQKFTYLYSLEQGKDYEYQFTLFYYQDGTEKETQVNELYDCFLKSFHALKP